MTKTLEKLTPLMQQYWNVKNLHLDKIVFFRMGDFFEIFYEDAETIAPILNLTLTQRNKKSGDHTAMCGMPHHSVSDKINKLLVLGFKVVICDQVEDAKQAKGLVRREVTRVLSPGMVYDPITLDSIRTNYIASFDEACVSFLDITTGEAFYYQYNLENELKNILFLIEPVEFIYFKEQSDFIDKVKLNLTGVLTKVSTFKNNLPLKFETFPMSAKNLLSYAIESQGKIILEVLSEFKLRNFSSKMALLPTVLQHLEIFKTYDGEKEGSFFNIINKTKTAPGARLLQSRVKFPVTDFEEIQLRLNRVEKWYLNSQEIKEIRRLLFFVGDVQRRVSKLSFPNRHPKDLESLKNSLDHVQQINKLVEKLLPKDLSTNASSIVDEIENTIKDDLPSNLKLGNFIKKGVSSELDSYIDITENSQEKIRLLEESERLKTGINSLKIRFNNVFGYYIEITKSHKDKIPVDRYQIKQTLTNAFRYTTDELIDIETLMLKARSSKVELEHKIFSNICEKVLAGYEIISDISNRIASLDVDTSLAWLALQNNYVKPSLSSESSYSIVGSRHPVIEEKLRHEFISNDINLLKNSSVLLTGPNMAGKSTIMRQVALTSVLFQIGSFVPATEAALPLLDNIFTRVGASDNLSKGLSTFMVEMTETSEILNNATDNSLIILDEIGRGTSTYDGMSLAQSILEYLIVNIKPFCFFATHYHELTYLDEKYENLENFHMGINELKSNIEFLYYLKKGGAGKSYGIQVAEIAGIKSDIIQRAKKLLVDHEIKQKNLKKNANNQLELFNTSFSPRDLDLEQSKKVIEELKCFTVAKSAPIDALNQIDVWQKSLQH